MKWNVLRLLIMGLMLSLIGAGSAAAGGYTGSYKSPAYGGYHKGGGYHQGGGYYHKGPYDRHDSHGCYRHKPYHHYHHYHYYHYKPPVRCYPYWNYYYRGYDYNRYDGAYYFSGAFSEPGFGFVFGTRGSW